MKIFSEFFLDTLFPIKCLFCNKEGIWICQKCFDQIKIETEHVCGVCEKVVTPEGKTCQDCKKKSFLSGLLCACSYAQPTISQAIHFFKYRFISDLHEPLGNLLIKTIKNTELPLPDIIIPIPLHSRRLRWRGFNQASLLGQHVAKKLLPNCEIDFATEILVRNRYTQPQMSIKNFISRKQNIEGAFSVSSPKIIKNKMVLLVDDVATTGSTIFECAKVLKTAGASRVFAIVLARQEVPKK